MKAYFFEILTALLFVGSLLFFVKSVGFLAHRDYVSAIILVLIGLAILSVGKETARLALLRRDET
jgi:hypothetical protein